MITKQAIIDLCKQVHDPEINIDIYTLGLIYDVQVSDQNEVSITMTYTTPLCPFGERIKQSLEEAISVLSPAKLTIIVTFEPRWEASQELRELLGV